MRIGIDFDNTIVCYDSLFHQLATERALIPPDLPATKRHVRDHLRQIGREDDWTELQAQAYGPRLIDAAPFDGVIAFFQSCREAEIQLTIISHKTRRPYRGGDYDLHEAARLWLAAHHIAELDDAESVFFEPTLDAKLARIAACHCTHFIDDLPEFLSAPNFPSNVQRILFDPHDAHTKSGLWRRVTSFGEILSLVEITSP